MKFVDLEAERATLGACLLSPEVARDLVDMVSAEDFSESSHREIYSGLTRLLAKGGAVDVTLLAGVVDPKLMGLVIELPTAVASTANARHYAARVAECAAFRRLRALQAEIPKIVDEAESSAEAIDALEAAASKLRGQQGISGWRSAGDLALEAAKDLEQRVAVGGRMAGLPTGLSNLDAALGGLIDEDLILLGGRPSMGKTALALQIGQAVADRSGPVGVFSLEMSGLALTQRMCASRSRVPVPRLRDGRLPDDAVSKAMHGYSQVAACRIFCNDKRLTSVSAIRSEARRLNSQVGVKLLVVDYLQLMGGSGGKNGTREREVAEVSRGLKNLAGELKIPILALVQLSRTLESRPVDQRRPRLADLRESGSLEQDGDVVLFVYRHEVYDPRPQWAGRAEIIVAKQRNGALGTLQVQWDPKAMTFAVSPQEVLL